MSIHRGMRILEIGPLAAPIAPKRDGWLTSVVDHSPRARLVETHLTDPAVDTERIEDVDIVWRGGALDATVARHLHGSFDACIASHVLEHVPDPIGLLVSLERLLAPSGVVSLVVPDKRFCFDFFRPLSSVGELLEAHSLRATQHSKRTLFDQGAYSVRSDGEIAWNRRPVTDIEFFGSLAGAKLAFDSHPLGGGDEYVDAHGWQFTPSSFELAILELAAVEMIDFSIEHLFQTETFEFFVTLRRGRRVPSTQQELDARRLQLLQDVLTETAEQARLLVEAVPPGSASPSSFRGSRVGHVGVYARAVVGRVGRLLHGGTRRRHSGA